MGVCPRCGTLFGQRGEIEEYAASIVSGQPLERPKSIPGRRLSVHFEEGTHGDYRSGAGDGSLVIKLRSFNTRSLIGLLVALLGLGGIALLWYLAFAAQVYAVATLGTALLGFYVWFRLTLLFDPLLIRLSGGQLLVSERHRWPRNETTLRAADIVQLSTIQQGNSYFLCARMTDGHAESLVNGIGNAALGVYLERQLETALGVADEPVPGELGRDVALPKPARLRLRGLVIELGVIGTLVLAPVCGIRTCGTALTQFEVGEQPGEASFELDSPAKVFFTAKIHLAEDKWNDPALVPQVLDFDIDILKGEKSVDRLSCNPFALSTWTASGPGPELDSFWGPMDHCSVKLPPGRYTVRAVRRWKPGAKHVGLDESRLGVRR